MSIFWWISILKVEVMLSSDILVALYETIRRHNPEDLNSHFD
jgi:hypothetical protein